MSVFYTDKVEIVNVEYDSETKIEINSPPVIVKGYWEEDSKLAFKDGLPIGYSSLIVFPIRVNINKGDLVKLVKKGNLDMTMNPDYMEYRTVTKSNIASSLGNNHKEVTV